MRWLALLLVTGMLTAVPAARPAAPLTSSQPNIVFIITDDETYAEAQHAATNASLDADLISQGVTFTNAVVSNPLCCPARTSILRGQTSSSTGVWTNEGPHGGWATAHANGDENSTIATWLHDDGYRTGLVGKYLNGYGTASWVPPGWDYWRAEEIGDKAGGYYNYRVSENGTEVRFGKAPSDYSEDVLSSFATGFISSTPVDQPLFLYVAYRAPHFPRTPAPRYLSDTRCADSTTNHLPDYNKTGGGAPSYIKKAPKVTATTGTTDPVQACLSLLATDDGVGAIVNSLAATGRLANTMLVFTSDNGLMFGEHRWVDKRVPYESSIHVPMIIRYDPLTAAIAGTTNASVVSNLDLAPTAAAAAGISPPIPEDGLSLLGLLDGSSTSVRDGVVLEGYSPELSPLMPSYCGWRTPQYVFVQYKTGEKQLFDLYADPYEMTNLATVPADATLRTTLQGLALAACSPPPPDWPGGQKAGP